MNGGWSGEPEQKFASMEPQPYTDPVASIITAYNRNFRPILPKNKPYGSDTSGKHTIRPKICLELIEQYEITVQLLIQNFLYCSDETIKQRCLEHFLRLVNGKETIIKFYRLPSYDICLSDFVGEALTQRSSAVLSWPRSTLPATPGVSQWTDKE